MSKMRGWIFVPLALLFGLAIGSWGPRSDLRTAKAELEATKKLLKDHSRRRGDLDGITRLIGIDERARGGAKGRPSPGTAHPAGGAPDGAQPAPSAEATNEHVSFSVGIGPDGRSVAEVSTNRAADDPADQRKLGERIDEAIELWKTRSDIARSTLLANLELTPEQALQFDVLVRAMNLRIGNTLQTLADNLKTNQDLNTESAIRVANDVTGAVIVGYKDLDRTLPDGWRQKAGKEFTLTDFVDPNVARPLIEVEDKLQGPQESGEQQRPRAGFGPRSRRSRSDENVKVK